MTKGECILLDYGFYRVRSEDMTALKHNGSSYFIRVYRAEVNGNIYRILCESYYGSTKVYRNGTYLGDYELYYEELPKLFAS
jgi:hypothetical protein